MFPVALGAVTSSTPAFTVAESAGATVQLARPLFQLPFFTRLVLAGGTFKVDGVEISGLSGPDGPATLGYRAEDAMMQEGGNVSAPVYSMELLGDATMVTIKVGGEQLSVKAAKDYRTEIDDIVHFSIPAEICHLFSAETGERIGA